MRLRQLLNRFFLPGPLMTVLAWWRFRCLISYRAEVELSKNLRIGCRTQVGSFTKIKSQRGPLEIGAHGHIGPNCFISSGSAGVRIGDYCMIAAGSAILGNNHGYERVDVPMLHQGHTSQGIDIDEDVWLGLGSVVLDGTSIGKGVIVTPNSVVSGRIPQYSIVQGNPAKVIFRRR